MSGKRNDRGQPDRRSALDGLGPLVMASTKASLLASYVWGRLSDRSSRQTLVAASLLAAVVFALVGGVGQTFDGLAADRLGAALVLFGFAAIAALGALLARGLDEVQQG